MSIKQEMIPDSTEPTLDLSVVIPIFNEEENLAWLMDELYKVLKENEYSYEVIAVDDGSTDSSYNQLIKLKERYQNLIIIRLRRNFGQTPALSAGFHNARGRIIVTIDADMQNDPQDIPALIEKLKQGYDLVSGWRAHRKDPALTRILPSRFANWLISKITGVKLHDHGCTLKAYHNEVIANIPLYGEMHRFLPPLAQWVGAKIAELPVNHHPRRYGKSKYGLKRTLGVILDLITVKFLMSYSTSPIRIFGAWGLYSIILGIISGIATVVMRILEIRTMTRNPLLTVTAILIIVGFQFIVLGLLGEINIRTYFESQRKPIYIIRNIVR